jgi:SPP1 gp7 family putative phage head morphogenesis protein
MTKQKRIQQVLSQTAKEVAELGISERKNLFIALRQAEGELSRGLADWYKNVPDASERFTVSHMTNMLGNVKEAMRKIEGLKEDAASALGKTRWAGLKTSTKHIKEQMEAFSSIFDGSIKPVNIKLASAYLDANKGLIVRHKSSAARYAGEVGTHVRRELSVGVLKGETIEEMTRRIMRNVPIRPDQALGLQTDAIADSVMRMPRVQAARLVRTEAIHAYNSYKQASLEDWAATETEQVMKRWDASLDARGCDECAGLDGEAVAYDDVFSNGSAFPPAHPNCRCTAVPWMGHWSDVTGKDKGTGSIDTPGNEPV